MGKFEMALLEKFGKPKIDCEVDEVMITEALHFTIHSYD